MCREREGREALFRPAQFPRSANYDPEWVLGNMMGPNALWLTECMGLEPGMRVLDMGCGKGMSSIFLAKEYGLQVWAMDLWIDVSDNYGRIRAAVVERPARLQQQRQGAVHRGLHGGRRQVQDAHVLHVGVQPDLHLLADEPGGHRVGPAPQYQGLADGILEAVVALLGYAVFVALTGVDAGGTQAVVVQQRLVGVIEGPAAMRPPPAAYGFAWPSATVGWTTSRTAPSRTRPRNR